MFAELLSRKYAGEDVDGAVTNRQVAYEIVSGGFVRNRYQTNNSADANRSYVASAALPLSIVPYSATCTVLCTHCAKKLNYQFSHTERVKFHVTTARGKLRWVDGRT